MMTKATRVVPLVFIGKGVVDNDLPGQPTGHVIVSLVSPGQSAPPLGGGLSHTRLRVVTVG